MMELMRHLMTVLYYNPDSQFTYYVPKNAKDNQLQYDLSYFCAGLVAIEVVICNFFI